MENGDEEMERRLRGLNAGLPVEGGFSERVMARIRVDAGSPHVKKDTRFWRLVMKGSFGIAASVAVGLAVWHVGVESPRAAYGVEDVPQRMLELKSLHMKGTIYGRDGDTPNAVEVFVQRPGWMRINGVRSVTNGVASNQDLIFTPTERTMIDPERKRVEISPERDVDAQLEAEEYLQLQMTMLLGTRQEFKKIGTQAVGGVEADVYEGLITMPSERGRVDVFLNPATGLPVRSEMYFATGGRPEKLGMIFETIEPNAVIGDGTFRFDVPRDYQVVKTREKSVGMTAQIGDARFGVRYTIALDEKRVLVCWYAYDGKHPTEDLNFFDGTNELMIRGNGGTVYREHLLRADPTEVGYHWRWSVLTTDQAAKTWADGISMSIHAAGGTSTDEFMAVKLPPAELAEVVEKVQRFTLPADGKAMTLQEIEAAK